LIYAYHQLQGADRSSRLSVGNVAAEAETNVSNLNFGGERT